MWYRFINGAKCRYGDKPCPIAVVQAMYNYEACNNEVATKILDELVKSNGDCAMYLMDPQTFSVPDAEQTELFNG